MISNFETDTPTSPDQIISIPVNPELITIFSFETDIPANPELIISISPCQVLYLFLIRCTH